ncbi:hypothetical protein [Nocardioides sp. MH1]|uniref:hypothetical protein n=1 Tax=Nocardioides sp. MH1 TaxID=3242490 RepID=UPI003521BC27
MSKEAALRAMREAKYARSAAPSAPTGRTDQPGQPAKPTKRTPARSAKKPAAEVPVEATTDELCGHRSMNGRTCTREKGHTAKSHRYS